MEQIDLHTGNIQSPDKPAKRGGSLWKKGTSGNPMGRPKNYERNIQGMVARFIKRNISGNKLQKMYDGMTDKEKIELITELLPFAIPKPQGNDKTPPGLPFAQLNIQVVQANNNTNGSTGHKDDQSISSIDGQ